MGFAIALNLFALVLNIVVYRWFGRRWWNLIAAASSAVMVTLLLGGVLT